MTITPVILVVPPKLWTAANDHRLRYLRFFSGKSSSLMHFGRNSVAGDR